MQNLVKDRLEIHFIFLGLKVGLDTHIWPGLLPSTNVIVNRFLPKSACFFLSSSNTA